MKISLIVTTYNRQKEMEKLFNTIRDNKYDNLEVIVVDQSSNNSIKELCDYFKKQLCIKYVKAGRMSLSKARNLGIKSVTGELIGFPDDDCWYEENFLNEISKIFEDENIHAICTGVYDPINNIPYSSIESKTPVVKINSFNVFKYTTSVGIFIRKDIISFFDENLGIGAKWYGGEDIDYTLRLLHNNKNLYYYNELKVYHLYNPDYVNIEKEFKYTIGYGAVIGKAYRYYNFKLSALFKYYSVLFKFKLYSLAGINKELYNTRISGMKKGFKEYRQSSD
ncbi:glycosyltransferase family 2 protein [Clostridium sp.]|uniref:glycosyltransferase family 2 protein n=1 Tax=Clostridium sp. TaxID=1506 RepID=UPI00346452C0